MLHPSWPSFHCISPRAAPAPLQVKEITQSLKEREAQARAAEEVAAAHLQREKRLIQHESQLLEREQQLAAAAAEASAAKAEMEALWAGQRQEAARLEQAAAAVEEREADVSAELAGRESVLAGREEELAAAMRQFEAEREQQAEADEVQRQRTLAELRRLESGIDEAMSQLRHAEEEGRAMRQRLQGVQRETGEAEAARDKALLAHKAAQQVRRGCGAAIVLFVWCGYRYLARLADCDAMAPAAAAPAIPQAAQDAQAAMEAALASGNEEVLKVRQWVGGWGWLGWAG
jgi:hypothetical protein